MGYIFLTIAKCSNFFYHKKIINGFFMNYFCCMKFTHPIYQTFNVNKDEAILHNVIIAEVGEAKGHGVFLNEKFIDNVAKFGNSTKDIGIKARFGHPNMCATTLGTYIGRYKNFSTDTINGKYSVVADLYLDEVAKESPNGDLYTYILEMSAKNPDMFGNSIVFKVGQSEFKKEATGEKDEKGKEIYREVEYATIESLLASDLVDSPAATDSLFDTNSFASVVTEFLDANPDIYEIAFKNPTVINEFIEKYENYKQNKNKMENDKTMLEKLNDKINALTDKFGNSDLSKEITALKEENETLKAELKAKKEEFENVDTVASEKLTALESEKDKAIAELKADFEAKTKELKAEKDKIKADFEAYAKEKGDNIEVKPKDVQEPTNAEQSELKKHYSSQNIDEVIS